MTHEDRSGRVDRYGPKPIAQQIAEDIGGDIAAGRLSTGDKLPDEPLLASRYGVTRDDIRDAIQLLTARRLLEVVEGEGTHVTPT